MSTKPVGRVGGGSVDEDAEEWQSLKQPKKTTGRPKVRSNGCHCIAKLFKDIYGMLNDRI